MQKLTNIINKIENVKYMNSIIKGVKHGWSISIMPKFLGNILNNIFVRIFRFLGGLCVLFVLLQKQHIIDLKLPIILNYIIMYMALFQMVQILIVGIIRFFYGMNKLINHSNEFEVRNSPLNRGATLITKLLYCYKAGCQVGQAGIWIVGTSVLLDTVLEAGGKEKTFTPMLGKLVPKNIDVKNNMNRISQELNNLKDAQERLKQAKKVQQLSTELFNSEIQGLTAQERHDINSTLTEIENLEGSKVKETAEKIKQIIDEESKKK